MRRKAPTETRRRGMPVARTWTLLLVGLVAGCAQRSVDAPGPLTAATASPAVLARFSGEVDPVAGTFRVWVEPAAASDGMAALALDPDYVTVGNSPDPVPSPLWNHEQEKCGAGYDWRTYSSGGRVRVTSKLPAGTWVRKAWAVIDTLDTTGAESCNSSANPPFGISPTNLGVWDYADLDGGAFAEKDWSFLFVSGTKSRFSGRIYGYVLTTFDQNAEGYGPLGWIAFTTAGTSEYFTFMTYGFYPAIGTNLARVGSDGSTTILWPLSQGFEMFNLAADGTTGVVVGTTSDKWTGNSPPTSLARVDLGTGQAVEFAAVPYATALRPTIDPGSGTIWDIENPQGASSQKSIRWMSPSDPENVTGSIAVLPGRTALGMLAVRQGTSCLLYVGLDDGTFGVVDCSTKGAMTAVELVAGCRANTGAYTRMNFVGTAAADGTVYFPTAMGSVPSVFGAVCKLSGNTLTKVADVTYDAGYEPWRWVMGPDGNLWVESDTPAGATLLQRLWLGASGAGTLTVPPGSWWQPIFGLESGAGAVWAWDQFGALIRMQP